MSENEVKIKIRKMTEADLLKVKEIDHRLKGAYRYVAWPPRIEEHWWAYRGVPNFVAEVRNELVGFLLGDIRAAQYGTAEACAWIDILGVLPEYQNVGVNRRLVEAFCRECHKEGVKVGIFIVSDNKQLREFFESCGFREGNLVSYEK